MNQLSPCSISISPLIILHPIALLRKLVRSIYFWEWLDHMVSDLIKSTSFHFFLLLLLAALINLLIPYAKGIWLHSFMLSSLNNLFQVLFTPFWVLASTFPYGTLHYHLIIFLLFWFFLFWSWFFVLHYYFSFIT